jgi:AraC-like DNA-binding protein
MIVCLEGERRSVMNGVLESQHSGEAMVVAPGVMHSSSYAASTKTTMGVTLELSAATLQRAAKGWRHQPGEFAFPRFFGVVSSPRIESVAGRIAASLRQPDRNPPADLRNQVLSLVEAVARDWPASQVVSSYAQPTEPQLSRRVLLLAIEFMATCPKERFCLSALSRHVGMSSSRFRSLFRSSFGAAPASLYNRMLLHRAAEALRTSGEPIATVAMELGFRTPSHFTEVFRRDTGLTPTEFRRQYRGAAI